MLTQINPEFNATMTNVAIERFSRSKSKSNNVDCTIIRTMQKQREKQANINNFIKSTRNRITIKKHNDSLMAQKQNVVLNERLTSLNLVGSFSSPNNEPLLSIYNHALSLNIQARNRLLVSANKFIRTSQFDTHSNTITELNNASSRSLRCAFRHRRMEEERSNARDNFWNRHLKAASQSQKQLIRYSQG